MVSSSLEGVYVTVGNPAFCLFLYLTGVHFRGELQHGGDVSQQKIKCRPIRTREIGGASLSDVLYACNWETLPGFLPGPVDFFVKYFTIIIPCVPNFPTYLSIKSKSYYNDDVILDLRTSLGWVAAKKSSDVNFYTWYEILTIQIKSECTT